MRSLELRQRCSERQTRLISTIDSSIQIYHPIFSTDNFESSLSLELVLQTVFDYAKSELPDAIAKRSIAATVTHFPLNVLSQRTASTHSSTWLRRRFTSPWWCRVARPSVPDGHESRGAHVEGSKMKNGPQFVYSIQMCACVYIHTLTLYVSDRKG